MIVLSDRPLPTRGVFYFPKIRPPILKRSYILKKISRKNLTIWVMSHKFTKNYIT